MIEKMKMVHIVTTASGKDAMLEGVRNAGIVHLAERKAPERALSERFADLSRISLMLKDYAPEDQKEKAVLSDEDFEAMYREVTEASERKTNLFQRSGVIRAEIERLTEWGDFSPEDVKALRESGYDLHFYRLGKAEAEQAFAAEDIRMIRLASVDGMDTVAVFGQLPQEIPASEFSLPEKSLEEYKKELEDCEKGMQECDEVFRKNSCYQESFTQQMLKTQNAENYSSASATAEGDGDFVWLTGYIPEADMEQFKKAAAEGGWAWAEEDVAEDDDAVPTKVRFNKVSGLIKPVFDILGILPGYREQDISLWFFLFFVLFFAMIIGDGGYGLLILLGTVVLNVKMKKNNNITFLLYVLSIATIIWGAITGTWFGMEAAMKVPFLKALVIPNFANYPQYFAEYGVTATSQQNTIMKFSFTIGAVQMALGSILSIRKKLKEKDLSWLADLGWVIAIVSMYLLSLFLVIGETLSIKPIFAAIIIAFLMVVVFGGMSPDKTFAEGLKSGLGDAFTTFLNTISCFGNVMSYIRLFAVGMAGLAISQSFNSIAAGFSGPLVILGVVVVIIGHALNLVMCFLSVVVHGVRLNVLEFSGQVGLEWTGIEYDPFKKNDKIKQ